MSDRYPCGRPKWDTHNIDSCAACRTPTWDPELQINRVKPVSAARRFTIEAIARHGFVKGWKIVRSDGRSLMGFTTRREAEVIVEFINGGQL